MTSQNNIPSQPYMPFNSKWLAPTFTVGGYHFLNNDSSAITPYEPTKILSFTVPALLAAWKAIERATGFRWRCTSFIRQSYSHKLGHSLDIVPDMTPQLQELYATSRKSDPILYGRPELFRRLQRLVGTKPPGDYTVVIAVESDHLHVQIQSAAGLPPGYRIWKWAAPKGCYVDTNERFNAVQKGSFPMGRAAPS